MDEFPRMWEILRGKRIVLGVCGSIAAYKACEIVRLLTRAEATVDVIMTRSAIRLIQPLTFQTLSERPVSVDPFETPQTVEIGHIALAQKADLIVIAPATVNTMAKLAAGMADDMLTTTVVAATCPILIAPAANTAMLDHPATRQNREILGQRGVEFVEPDFGELACGTIGEGRLADPWAIVDRAARTLEASTALEGFRVMVTAGPTREYIDPVRFISNPSSGKMGFAIAAAARRMGAEVLLISGPVTLPTPFGIDRLDVETAREMEQAVLDNLPGTDVYIGVAAVGDYGAAAPSRDKIRRAESETMVLELKRTPDILAAVSKSPHRPQLVVGFAAETGDPVAGGQTKLRGRKLDFVVVNQVTASGAPFNRETNRVWLIDPSGNVEDSGEHSKAEIARWIVSRLAKRLVIRTAEPGASAVDIERLAGR